MALRVRALLAYAAIVAALCPLASVQAQEGPNDATAAALAHLRSAALSRIVDPRLHDAVAAMYADQLVDQSVMNEATANQIAEQAALTDLSKDEQVQIQNWFAQVAAGMGPTFRDTND